MQFNHRYLVQLIELKLNAEPQFSAFEKETKTSAADADHTDATEARSTVALY
jgi:hypothetical protein